MQSLEEQHRVKDGEIIQGANTPPEMEGEVDGRVMKCYVTFRPSQQRYGAACQEFLYMCERKVFDASLCEKEHSILLHGCICAKMLQTHIRNQSTTV